MILVSALLVTSGFGIIHDSIVGTFPPELELLRQLFVFSWCLCIVFFVVSVYLSRRFYSVIYSWIDTQHFIADSDARDQLKQAVTKALDTGYGPIPLFLALLIYSIRHVVMLFMTPSSVEPGVYAYWYIGADFMYSLFVIITVWSLILFSAVLHYVASKFPLRIRDVAEYADAFEKISKLANGHILLTAFTMGLFFLGILYWAFSMGTFSYYAAAMFLFVLALIGIALISWLNFSGIQKGLEKTKKLKIISIRSGLQPPDIKDLQISLHSKVSIWKVGPRMFESILLAILVAELLTLLQYVGNALLKIFSLF